MSVTQRCSFAMACVAASLLAVPAPAPAAADEVSQSPGWGLGLMLGEPIGR